MQDVEQLKRKASEHFQAGRYRKAEKIYREMIGNSPDDYQAMLMLGVCRQHRQDSQGALEYFRQAVAANDNQPETHFHLGRQFLEMRRIEESRESLAQAVALDPNHAPARTLLGYSFIMSGDYQRAIDDLKIARRADQNYAPGLTMLALALLEVGQVDEAAEHANRAVHLAPQDAGAHSILGRVLLAQGHPHFAEQCFRNALEKHPGNLELKAGLGKALRRMGRSSEAAEILEAVLREGMRMPEIVTDYARALADLGRVGEAGSLLEQLPDEARDEETNALLANLKLAAGDMRAARELSEMLPDSSPEKALLIAKLHMVERSHRQAAEVLRPWLDHPSSQISRRARLGAAEAYLVEKDSEAAYGVLEPLLTADPPDLAALDRWVGFLRRERRWEALLEWLETLLAHPGLNKVDRARAAGLMAVALDATGQASGAAEFLEDAAWREPEFLEVYSNETSRRMRNELMAATDEKWQELNSVSGKLETAPVFLLGWPGSGQAELAATLAAHSEVRAVPADDWRQRVGLAGVLSRLDGEPVSAEQCFQSRQQFLSPVAATGERGVVLDPTTYEITLLPGIARLFPGATVIVVSAQEADLHLHWVMSGFRRPLDILDAYRRERELFQHIQDKLPLKFIVLSRHRLLGEPGETLENLYGQLGLAWDPANVEDFRKHVANGHLRPDGHWKQYAALLGRD